MHFMRSLVRSTARIQPAVAHAFASFVVRIL